MSRIVRLLTVGMLLCLGSIGASAAPRSDSVVGRPVTADLDLAQLDDGGRCFNTCVSGNIFRRCQVDSEGEKENCCSRVCNRVNNWNVP